MDRYRLQGTVRDTRKLGSFITSELLDQLSKGNNYTIKSENGTTTVQYNGPLFYINVVVERVLRGRIVSHHAEYTLDRIDLAIRDFCHEVRRLIAMYVSEDISGKWYSPFLLWEVIGDYLTSGEIMRGKLANSVLLDYDTNEGQLYLESRMDKANSVLLAGSQNSSTTAPVSIIADDGVTGDRQKISNVDYWIEWLGAGRPHGDYAVHWYDSFGIPHVHRFPTVEMARRFILWCLYRTWKEEIQMTNADENSVVRRMTYMPAFPNGMSWEFEGRDLIKVLYSLAALPVPTIDVRVIPTDVREFIQYCLDVYDNYQMTLQGINVESNAKQIIVSNWQLEKMEESGLLTDRSRIRLYEYESSEVVGGVESQQLFTGQNGPVIEYPLGPVGPIEVLSRATIVNTDIMRKQRMNEDILMLTSAYPLYVNPYTGGPPIDECALLETYAATWGVRKVFSDLMYTLLAPETITRLNIQSEFGEGINFDDGLIINGYLYDSPTNYELVTTGDASVLRLGIPGTVISAKWNSSTMKLLAITVAGMRLGRDDAAFYAALQEQRSVVILGATDEPLGMKLQNISRGNWTSTAIGDMAEFPNKTSTFEGLMYTGSADIVISDMSYESTITDTAQRVVGYRGWVTRTIMSILQNQPSLVIFKIQWPVPGIIDDLCNEVADNYGIKVYSCGGSPTLSEELFLVLSTVDTDRVSADVLSEYIWRLSLQTQSLTLPPLKQVQLTQDLDTNNVGPGDHFVMTGPKTKGNDILSVASNLSGHVLGGLLISELGVTSLVNGFVDIVRLDLFARRRAFRRNVNVLGRLRFLAGGLPPGMSEPRMLPVSAVRAFQLLMSYTAGTYMRDLNPMTLVSLGGGQFNEVWWTSNVFHLYDRNVTFDPECDGVFVHRETVTDATIQGVLEQHNGAYSAINSLCMQQGDTHAMLISRIKKFIDYTATSGNPGILSLYKGDLSQAKKLPAIKRFGKFRIDVNTNLQWFTFGKYGLVPMLNEEQSSELFTYALEAGVAFGDIFPPALCGGAVNARFGSMVNGSFLTTAHQLSLVHGYVSLRKL